jgi:hypothetical protein
LLCPYTTKFYSNMYVHIRTHTGKWYFFSVITDGGQPKKLTDLRYDDTIKIISLRLLSCAFRDMKAAYLIHTAPQQILNKKLITSHVCKLVWLSTKMDIVVL